MDTTTHKITIESNTDGICTMLNALAYAAAVTEEKYQKALAENNAKTLELYTQLSMQFLEIYHGSLESVQIQLPEVYKLFITDFYTGKIIDDVKDFLDF